MEIVWLKKAGGLFPDVPYLKDSIDIYPIILESNVRCVTLTVQNLMKYYGKLKM